jgi:glycosyltransferase involved in cell wall biosynthesis
MKIGFVAEPYEETHASGMGFVVSELLRNLLEQGKEHEFVVYSSKEVRKDFIPGNYRFVRIPNGFLRKMLWFVRMRKEVGALLFIAPLLPLILPRGIRPIVICQELASQKITPEGLTDTLFAFLRDRILMPLCFRRAESIAAASHATKTDIERFYPYAAKKVTVIYDGYQDLSRFASSAPHIDEALKPYFFFAGKVKYRKNVHGIAEAFASFKNKTRAPAKLVIAGDYGGEYYERIMRTLREAGATRDVHFVGYVSGAQLYSYYKHALAVTFPSINEGFGMPIIEAFAVGTPVITSNISSMAEAAGEAGVLVDPHDPQDISRAMERVYAESGYREQLIAKGYVRAKDFSWKKAAGEFLSLIAHDR